MFPIEELQSQCDKEDNRAFCKDQFLKAVRKFMEMKTLTPTILHESASTCIRPRAGERTGHSGS